MKYFFYPLVLALPLQIFAGPLHFSECKNNGEGSSDSFVIYDPQLLTVIEHRYTDPDCPKAWVMSMTTANYHITSTPKGPEFKTIDVFLSVEDSTQVKLFNEKGICGFKNWEESVHKSILGKTCLGKKHGLVPLKVTQIDKQKVIVTYPDGEKTYRSGPQD